MLEILISLYLSSIIIIYYSLHIKSVAMLKNRLINEDVDIRLVKHSMVHNIVYNIVLIFILFIGNIIIFPIFLVSTESAREGYCNALYNDLMRPK